MRTTPILAGIALTLVAAGATMAASPSPSPSQSPAASPHPSPAVTAPPAGSANAAGTLSAQIKPLDATSGTVSVATAADGSGTITVTLKNLRADARWTVDVDGGTLGKLLEARADEIAFRAGMSVERLAADTVRIHLSAAEMRAFQAARKASGIVVLVSDGTNRAAAVFAAA